MIASAFPSPRGRDEAAELRRASALIRRHTRNPAVYIEELGKIVRTGYRSSGIPVIEHDRLVASFGVPVAAKRYKVAMTGATLGHDQVEDPRDEDGHPLILVRDPKVHSPRQTTLPGVLKKPRELVLNDELGHYGYDGDLITGIIYLVTREKKAHRSKTGYTLEVRGEYDEIVGPKLQYGYHLEARDIALILALAVKDADFCANTTPWENYSSVNDLPAIRGAMGSEGELKRLLARMEVSDKFVRDGKIVSFSEERFEGAMSSNLEQKKRRLAREGTGILLPAIEQRLLIVPGLASGPEGDVFDCEKVIARTSEVYNYVELDRLHTRALLNCLDILYAENHDPNIIYAVKDSFEAPVVTTYSGYDSVLKRIRLVVRDAILDFELKQGKFSGMTEPPPFFFWDAYKEGVKSGIADGSIREGFGFYSFPEVRTPSEKSA